MTLRHSIIIATLLATLSAASICRSQEDRNAAPENSLVVWSDGGVSEGWELTGWGTYKWAVRPDGRFSRERNEGVERDGSSVSNARFEGQPMFSNGKKFARFLHNTNRKTAWIGPFVEMTGGDVFPGTLIQGPVEGDGRDRNGRGREDSGLFATVEASAGVRLRDKGQVLVRADSIARIAFIDDPRHDVSPGLIVYRDGREVLAERIEWEAGGVHLLLPDGVTRASWEELAEVHFPLETGGTTGPAARQQATHENRLMCRLVTSSGAILTYPLDTSIRWNNPDRVEQHVVHPAWASTGLPVHMSIMVSHSFFRENEIPLSSLPAKTLTEENITGYTWKWKRNQNVRGEQLTSGAMVADLGIGMHSHCEVAFELPENSLTFTAWVGIDEAVGDGGCVRCKVFRDEVSGEPAWSSGLSASSSPAPSRPGS